MPTTHSKTTKHGSPIGVIFDMDGVLVDSAEPHYRSWELLAEELGGSVTRDQFAGTFGRQNRDIIPRLFGQVSEQQIRTLADRKEAIYRDLIRDNPPVVPGAKELIRDLHDRGVPLAVGSSGPPENIRLILAALDAHERISVIVSGQDVSRGKPDPEVFTLAAGRLGVTPRRCVVVEDAPVGIQAARAAGVRTVAVLLYHPADAFDGADICVPHLANLTVARLLALAHKPATRAEGRNNN